MPNLKHKTSEIPPSYEVDMENGLSSYNNRRMKVFDQSVSSSMNSATPLVKVLSQSQRMPTRGKVAIGIIATVSLLMAIEMMVVTALMAGPTIDLLKSTRATFDMLHRKEAFTLELDIDSGPHLTALLGDNQALVKAGASLLGGGSKSSEDLQVHNLNNDTNIFENWCRSASCMKDADATKLCSSLESDLASARNEDGSPIIPLPDQFCAAVDVLNMNRCLCDPDLADPSKVGESSQIVENAPILGTMCGLTIGAC